MYVFSSDFKAFFYSWTFWSWILLYSLKYSFIDNCTLSQPDLRSTLSIEYFFLSQKFYFFFFFFFCKPCNKTTVLQYIWKQFLYIWYCLPLILSVWMVRSKVIKKFICYSFNKLCIIASLLSPRHFSAAITSIVFLLDLLSPEWLYVEMFSWEIGLIGVDSISETG